MASLSSTVGCQACGSRRTFKAFDAVEVPGFALFECRDCGSARTWPSLPERELDAFYSETYYGRENARFNSLFETLTRWFRRRRARMISSMSAGGTAVDVGCGRGFILYELRRLGFAVRGIEVSDVAAVHARQRLGIEVITCGFLDAPLDPRSVDVMIFWHSLEHLRDIDEVLKKAGQVIREGGLLVVAVPNFASLQARLFRRNWFHLDVPRHYHHFTLRALQQLLERHGFRTRTVAHFSLEQNPYGWIQSTLNALGFDINFLYSALKDHSARTFLRRERPLQTLLTLLAVLPVSAFAAVMTLLEVALRRGGTIELYAVRDSPVHSKD